MRRFVGAIGVVAVLAGCASKQDLRQGDSFMGGYSDEQVKPGLYEVTTTDGRFAGSARSTWTARADQLCGKGQHVSLDVETRVVSSGSTAVMVGPGLFVPIHTSMSSMRGYVLCASSSMSRPEAEAFIAGLPEWRKQQREAALRRDLDDWGGPDCDAPSPKDTAESFYQRGKLLMDQSMYQPARVCLLKAARDGRAADFYADVCTRLGEMYELGFGVPVDKAEARVWYGRAGLL